MKLFLRLTFCVLVSLSVADDGQDLSPSRDEETSRDGLDAVQFANHPETSPSTEDVKPPNVPPKELPSDQLSPSELSSATMTSHIGGGAISTDPDRDLGVGGDHNFWSGLFSSLVVILVSELGDKTFFIAAILSMRHNRSVVFGGALAALALMTVLSAGLGYAVPNLLPKAYTHAAATILFFYFGVRLFKEAYAMTSNEVSEEMAEVEEELRNAEETEDLIALEAGADKPDYRNPRFWRFWRWRRCSKWLECFSPPFAYRKLQTVVSPVFLEAFTLTFLAEWGDRSQVATIALAASKDPIGVTLGGVWGHTVCTALAVLGGKLLASKISERAVTFTGSILFLAFGFHSFITGE